MIIETKTRGKNTEPETQIEFDFFFGQKEKSQILIMYMQE